MHNAIHCLPSLFLSPCVCAFFFIFLLIYFDLISVLHPFFEVIGELVIRDQLDSS